MPTIALDKRREGFALPMAILLIGFMTAGLVGGFMRQSNERSIVNSGASQTTAFAVAEAGLEDYIAAGTTTSTTVQYTYAKGTATVVATQIKAAASATDTAIWLVRSTGVANGGTGKNPPARRTVAQLAYKFVPQMQVLSSWTSLSGLDKSGASGSISGADACGVVTPAKAGTTVPDGGYDGHTTAVSGNPAIDYSGTQAELAAEIKIDWAGIVAATSISPDVIYCRPGTTGYYSTLSPCGAFPASSAFTSTYWPTILINGSSPLPADGHGLLIVTGDLDLNGGDTWDGIILVGGIITDNGNGGISGAVVTGLNVKIGQTVGESSIAHGTKDYAFNSCDVAKATQGMSKLNVVKNSWMDTWSAW